MRLTSLPRRSLAVLSITAVLATGGSLSGVLTGTAFALGEPVVTGITPDVANNTATVSTTIRGSNFIPARAEVFIRPTFTATEVSPDAPIKGTIPAGQVTTDRINATFDIRVAAPGAYDVLVRQTDLAGGSATGVCSSCFNVTTIGPPNATSVAFGPNTPLPGGGTNSRGAGAIDITGANFAKGASVKVLLPDGTPDPHVSFVVNNPSSTAYPSTNLLRGNYSTSLGFVPGRHVIKVTNVDGTSGTTADFWLPYFTEVNPSTRGIGSANQVVTVTGSGIRAGSGLSISDLDTSNDIVTDEPCQDIIVGGATVSADGTSISAPVTLQNSCGNPVSLAGRSVGVHGPDGAAFIKSNQFFATAQPILNFPTGGLKVGRGAAYDLTLTGSGFAGGVVFSFGDPEVTAVTKQVAANGQSALVGLSVGQNAALGAHNITVTNPDAGTSTRGPQGTPSVAPLTINPAPLFTSINPASAGLGTSRTVTLTGSGFEAMGNGTGLSILFNRPGITARNITVNKGSSGAPDTATFTVTVDSTAPPGLSNVTVKNVGDNGSSTCVDCFGIDNLSVTPSSRANTAIWNLSFNGAGLSDASVPHLVKAGDNPDQPDIHVVPNGSLVTSNNGTTVTAPFDLTNVAPGKYNAVATSAGANGPVQVTCSSCFTVSGTAATVTGIRRASETTTTVTASGGQGAVDIPVVIRGTNFSRGSIVTIAGATVSDVRWVSTTELTGKVSIAGDASTGAQDVVLTNADGQFPFTYADAFTVNAGPKPTAVSPAAVGQGAAGKAITITGPGFQSNSTVSFGPGVSVTKVEVTQGAESPLNTNPSDTLVATVTIDEDAATGPRAISVSNPDSGQGTLTGAFTINPGPKVLSISDPFFQPGDNAVVTITGTGFKANPTITIANVTPSEIVVNAEGTSITARFVAETPCSTTSCALGARAVAISNSTDSGRTVQAGGFTIANPPVAPTNVQVPSTSGSGATVTWGFPTTAGSDGGSPLTGFVVDDGDAGTNNSVTVGSGLRTANLTGLVNGKVYTFTVKAVNGVGTGSAGTKTATVGVSDTATKLTNNRTATSVAGNTVVLSGQLTRVSTGAALAGQAIRLTLSPYAAPVRTVSLTTNASGIWSYRFVPNVNTGVQAQFLGTSTLAPATSRRLNHLVAARIVRRAPGTPSTTPVSSTIEVRGFILPNKAGRLLYLKQGESNLAITRVAQDGTFLFRIRPGRGSYTVRLNMPPTPGTVSGWSFSFVMHRT